MNWPLSADNRTLNLDLWSRDEVVQLLAGGLVLVLACILGCAIIGTVCHAIGEAGKAWLDEANGRRR